MAGTTTKQALPYPTGPDVPFVHLDFLNLATAMDGRLVTVCTETTPSDTRPTGAARFAGAVVYCTDTNAYGFWDSGAGKWRMFDARWQAYAPTWSSTGTAPSIGNGSVAGRYRRMGEAAHVKIHHLWGSTTNGGTGGYSYTVPSGMAAADDEHGLFKVFVAGDFSYTGHVLWPGAAGYLQPYLPTSATDNRHLNVQNARSSDGAAGTGVPVIAGAFTYTNGSNLHVDVTARLA